MDVSPPIEPPAATGGSQFALIVRNLCKEYRPGQPVLRNISFAVAGRGMTAIIGPSGTGKSTLCAASTGWSSRPRGNPVPRQGHRRARSPRTARDATPHRHGVPGIQSGRTAFGDRECAVRPARICAGMAGLAAQIPGHRYRSRIRSARCGWPRCFRHDARRPAFRGPASTRRHRSRSDAGPRPCARRRADLLARSENLGRDHGVDRPVAPGSATSR